MTARAGRRKRGGGPVRVGDLLPDLAERGGWGQVVDLCRLRSRWGELMGPAVAAHSAPERIGRGRLTVSVDNSAWLMQLSFYRDEMRAKVSALLGEERVGEVFLKVGRLPAPGRRAVRTPRPVSPEAVREVEACIAAVPDGEVRDALRSLLLKDAGRGGPGNGG